MALAGGTGTDVEVRLRIEETRLPLFVDGDYGEGIRMASAALDLSRRTGIDVPRAEYLLGSALGLNGAAGWDEHLEAAMIGARSTDDTQTELLSANNLISLVEPHLLGETRDFPGAKSGGCSICSKQQPAGAAPWR